MRNFTTELQGMEKELREAGFSIIHSRNTHLEWFREFRAIRGDVKITVTYDSAGRSRFVYGRVEGYNDRGRLQWWETTSRTDWGHMVQGQAEKVQS